MRRRPSSLQTTLPLFGAPCTSTLLVVPTERHVERLWRAGSVAETRAALRSRLVSAFTPDVSFADPVEARIAFGAAFRSVSAREARLVPVLEAGGVSWARAAHAFDAAVSTLRAAGTPARALANVGREASLHAWIARVLHDAMATLDATLAKAGRVDSRLAPILLAQALGRSAPDAVASVLGTTRVDARWILAWDAADVAWWRALDTKLSALGGGARICLPTVVRPLDAALERDAFDVLADDLARQLEESPELEPLADAWGEPRLGAAPSERLRARVELCAVPHAGAQAQVAAQAIEAALRSGVPPERVAVLTCSKAAAVVRPVCRALAAAGIPVDESTIPVDDEGLLGMVWEAFDQHLADAPRVRSQHTRAARELLATLGLAPRLGAAARGSLAGDAPRSGTARADLEASCRDAQAWDALASTLDRYEAFSEMHASDDAVLPAVFTAEVRASILEQLRPSVASRIGAVRVARAGELAAQDLDVLVVVDANDGAAPWARRPYAILSEAMVADLGRVASAAAPCGASTERARELAALTLALAGPQRVVLVHRERDDDGSILAPAPLVAWLARAGLPVARWAPETTQPVVVSLASAARARVELARESFFFDASRAAGPDTGQLVLDDVAREAIVVETGGGPRALSVTALEKMATCAFRGFGEHILGARSPAVAADLPDAREEGTLAHEALAAAFTATQARWGARPRDRVGIRRDALAAAERLLVDRGADTGLRRLTIQRTLATVAAVVEWSLDDEDWDFSVAEQPFGANRKGTWPDLRVSGSLCLRGQVDRVDVRHGSAGASTALRVLDYKRRAHTAREASARLGATALQLPLYAVAASAALGGVAEGGYVPFTPRDLTGFRASPKHAARMRELVEGDPPAVLAVAQDIVDKMRRGALAPRPWEERACARCELDGACRKPRFAIEPEE